MRWLTEAADDRELMFTVTYILDFITVTTTLQGKNNWDDTLVLTTGNQLIKDEYGFAPYESMWAHEIEVEAL